MSVKDKIKLGLAGLALVLLLFFVFANTEPVEVNIILGKVKMWTSVLIILCLGMGAGMLWLIQLVRRSKKKEAEPPKAG